MENNELEKIMLSFATDFKTLVSALGAKENVNNQNALSLDDSKLTFNDWLPRWYDLYKKDNIRDCTKRKYLTYIYDDILPKIGTYTLSGITGEYLQEYINSISGSNKRKKISILLNASLEKARKLRKIFFKPFDSVELKRVRVKHYIPLEFAQQNLLLAKMQNKLYISVFWVMCCTGMRVSEFLALDFCKDIDFKEKTININKGKDIITGQINDTKSESSTRQIPFLSALSPHLKTIQRHLKSSTISYAGISNYFKRVYKNNKIVGCNVHSFRHTFISVSYLVGMREKTIQTLAGHSDISVTLNVYTHLLKKGTSPLFDYLKALNCTF